MSGKKTVFNSRLAKDVSLWIGKIERNFLIEPKNLFLAGSNDQINNDQLLGAI